MEVMMMRVLLIFNCLVIVAAIIGHEKLLTSNTIEYSNHGIRFTSPLPNWVNGTLMRNGPGQFEFGSRKVKHSFDGFAKMTKIKFQGDDTALFSTAFIHTYYYQDSRTDNTVAPYMVMLMPEPEYDDVERIEQLINGYDNANVNIFNMHSAYVATTDTWFMWQIDPASLATMGRVEAVIPGGDLLGQSSLSCTHPLPEHGTSNWINWVQELGKDFFQVVRYTSATERETIAAIEHEGTLFVHSFGMTKNYVILVLNPVEVNFPRYMETGGMVTSLDWFPERGSKIHVVNIHTGEVITLAGDSFLGLHYINAFEVGNGTLIADVISYPDIDILVNSTLDNMMDKEKHVYIPAEKAQLARLTIDLNMHTVERRLIPQTPGFERVNSLDFPVINEAYRYEEYCYIYGFTPKYETYYFDVALVKKDLCGTTGDKVWFKPNHYIFEPTFIPNPAAKTEDDGLIVAIVMDGVEHRSYVAVFDAQTLTLVNEADLPTPVPMSFHGRYFDEI